MAGNTDRDGLPGEPRRKPTISLKQFRDPLAQVAEHAAEELDVGVRVAAQRDHRLINRDDTGINEPPVLHLLVDFLELKGAPLDERIDILPSARHPLPISNSPAQHDARRPFLAHDGVAAPTGALDYVTVRDHLNGPRRAVSYGTPMLTVLIKQILHVSSRWPPDVSAFQFSGSGDTLGAK